MRWSRAHDTDVERERVCCVVNVDERARGQANGGVRASTEEAHGEKGKEIDAMSTQRGSIQWLRQWACSSSGKRV